MEHAAISGYAGELNNDEARTVAEICRRLDGNPLAIEFAGSRLIHLGFAKLLEELRGPSILKWSSRLREPKHRTLEATLDRSFRHLSDLERRILARLSTLGEPFTMEIALAQARDGLDDDQMIAQAVEELGDKSLISIVPLDDSYVYRIPEITRHYIQMKLAQSCKPIQPAAAGRGRGAKSAEVARPPC
jgi:predicted ATPase